MDGLLQSVDTAALNIALILYNDPCSPFASAWISLPYCVLCSEYSLAINPPSVYFGSWSTTSPVQRLSSTAVSSECIHLFNVQTASCPDRGCPLPLISRDTVRMLMCFYKPLLLKLWLASKHRASHKWFVFFFVFKEKSCIPTKTFIPRSGGQPA